MRRIIPYLMAMSLLLAGCMSSGGLRGPWIKTEFVDPWYAAGKHAEVSMRYYHNPYKSSYMKPHLRHSNIRRPIDLDVLGREFSLDYFTRTNFWRQWPTTGNTVYFSNLDRKIFERKVPFRFYLVSISPTVIVGISKEEDRFVRPKEGGSHPLAIDFVGLTYDEHVWMMTQLSASPSARLVYFAPKLSMDLELLNLDSGSTAINLPDESQLTVSREGSTINIVRENIFPTK